MRGSYLRQIAQPLAQPVPPLRPARRWPMRPGEERPAAVAAPDRAAAPELAPMADVPRPPRVSAAALPPEAEAQPVPALDVARPEPLISAPSVPRATNIESQNYVRPPPTAPSETLTVPVAPQPPELIAPAPALGNPDLPPPAMLPPLPRHLAQVSRSVTEDPASNVPLRADDAAGEHDAHSILSIARSAPRPAAATQERIARATPAPRVPRDQTPTQPEPHDVPPPQVPAREALQPAPPPRAVALPPRMRASDVSDRTVRIGSIEVRVTSPPAPPTPPVPAARAPSAAPAPSAAAPLSRGFASTFGLRQG